MPKWSGGAQQLRRGDRVRVSSKHCYRHYLRGLEGEVTQVLHHGVIVALDNDPVRQQRVIGTAGAVGPKVPDKAQRQFMFNELEKVDP
jgi:hypothetical protein